MPEISDKNPPLVPKSCVGCGCCCSYIVDVDPEPGELDARVPRNMIDFDFFKHDYRGLRVMKRKDNGRCIAFDEDKKLCSIYEKRPVACREFLHGCKMCLEALKYLC